MKLQLNYKLIMYCFIICLLVTLLYFLIPSFVCTDVINTQRHLRHVHVLFRHGARTPADTYPNDPYINETFYPIGWGHLTNNGKKSMYQFGLYLRERYKNYLSDIYDPRAYDAISTDVDRTRNSVELVNAGLWPPNPDQKWGALNWQPIPVHYQQLANDMLLLVRPPCPRYHLERDWLLNTTEIQSKFFEYNDLFRRLSELTGRTIDNFDDVQDVYNTLYAEEMYGLSLPDWTRKFYPEPMKTVTELSYIINAYNDRMNQFKGGRFIAHVLADWSIVQNLTDDVRRMKIYCGHDSTIVNVMRTLHLWDQQMPDYGIAIFFEFSYDTIYNDYGIEIFLKNQSGHEPYRMQLPGCDIWCPLDQFRNLTKDVVIDDWSKACEYDGYTVPPPLKP